MVKLRNIDFHFVSKNQEVLNYRADVNVGVDGIFSVLLDPRLGDTALRLSKNSDFHVTLTGAGNLRIGGASLDRVKQFIADCAKDFLECESTTERVIVYGHRIEVSFWKDGDAIFPNGYDANGHVRSTGEWFKHGKLNATTHAQHFTVGLAARVFNKTTHRRKSGETVEYEHLSCNEFQKGTWGQQLNSFVGFHIDPKDFEQMPYTEEAAGFFFGAMLNLCRLAEQIQEFFGDKAVVEKAIAYGGKFLLKG